MLTPHGNVAIEKLRVGDKVIAVDVYGETSIVTVHALLVHPDSAVTELETELGVIRTTRDHPFWVGKDEYVNVRDMKIGDSIVHINGDDLTYVEITDIRDNMGIETTYNLTVDAPHTYIADGMVVHNIKVE